MNEKRRQKTTLKQYKTKTQQTEKEEKDGKDNDLIVIKEKEENDRQKNLGSAVLTKKKACRTWDTHMLNATYGTTKNM